jgi:hypothetical protein
MRPVAALHVAGLALSVVMAGATDGVISDAFFSRSLQGAQLHGAWQAQQPSQTSPNASSFVHLSEQLGRQAHSSAVIASRTLAGSLLADTASVLARELGSVRASSGSVAHGLTAVLVVCGGRGDCDVARVMRVWLGGAARVWAVVGGGNPASDLDSRLHGDIVYGDAGQAVFWRESMFGRLSQDVATVVIDRGSGLSESQVLVSLRECLPHVSAGGSVITVGGSRRTGAGAEASLVYGSLRVRELEARCGSEASVAAPAESGGLSWSAVGSGLGSLILHGNVWMYWAGAKRSEINATLMEQSGMARMDDVRAVIGRSSSSATLGVWGLDEELDGLVTDLHGWWGYSEVTATRPPGIVNAAGGSSRCLAGSRRLRQSLLGERWRSWFMRSTEAVSWGPSWTLVRRVHRVGSRSFPSQNAGGIVVQEVSDLALSQDGYRGYVGINPTLDWLNRMVAAGAISPRAASPPMAT